MGRCVAPHIYYLGLPHLHFVLHCSLRCRTAYHLPLQFTVPLLRTVLCVVAITIIIHLLHVCYLMPSILLHTHYTPRACNIAGRTFAGHCTLTHCGNIRTLRTVHWCTLQHILVAHYIYHTHLYSMTLPYVIYTFVTYVCLYRTCWHALRTLRTLLRTHTDCRFFPSPYSPPFARCYRWRLFSVFARWNVLWCIFVLWCKAVVAWCTTLPLCGTRKTRTVNPLLSGCILFVTAHGARYLLRAWRETLMPHYGHSPAVLTFSAIVRSPFRHVDLCFRDARRFLRRARQRATRAICSRSSFRCPWRRRNGRCVRRAYGATARARAYTSLAAARKTGAATLPFSPRGLNIINNIIIEYHRHHDRTATATVRQYLPTAHLAYSLHLSPSRARRAAHVSAPHAQRRGCVYRIE